MRNTADVVIIGGGIAGVSALYYLVEGGINNILLVEMDRIASGTTGHTSAFVTLQEPSDLGTRMSLVSYPEFCSFMDKFEVDIGFKIKGTLSLDIAKNSKNLHHRAKFQNSIEVPTEILSREDILSIAPFLNLSDVDIGLFCREGGPIDPHPYIYALIKHAKSSGAEIREEVKATNILIENGRVIGVDTTHGTVFTNTVVNAGGIYASEIGKWINIDIPLTNALRHTIRTEPCKSVIPQNIPMIEILNPEEIYIETKAHSLDFSLGFDITNTFTHHSNIEALFNKYGNAILFRMPLMEKLGVQSCEAGIRSMTPDDLPILGPVEAVSGYINDCGWGGSGVSLAPAGGKIISEFILGTNNLPISIEPFLLKRFQPN